MAKRFHEVRDPIHVFIHYTKDERDVIDSFPLQRLRHIHQLAMTYLVYPGATHKRFEHSLGVMELASRVYDVITNIDNDVSKKYPQIHEILGELTDDYKKQYWKQVLRMAALCHDIGHLPFSHAAEKELLPDGWSHERITSELILSNVMSHLWDKMKLKAEDIAKIAVGPRDLPDIKFTDWELLLSEIIVGDAFGVDRMDYLLRDSLHAGVVYGEFDHYRLIDSLRILPLSKESSELTLGVDYGGMHTAEALLLARYFMFVQVYLHPVRRSYDIHLKDFLNDWLGSDRFPTDINKFLEISDNEITAAFLLAARDASKAGHIHANRLVRRDHFKVLYKINPSDLDLSLDPGKAIFDAIASEFGEDNVRHDNYSKEVGAIEFPVLEKDGRIVNSIEASQTISNIPSAKIDFVFINPSLRDDARDWLDKHRIKILKDASEKEEES